MATLKSTGSSLVPVTQANVVAAVEWVQTELKQRKNFVTNYWPHDSRIPQLH